MGLLQGLYAYYKLDEVSGNALDASGNARNLPNFSNPIGTGTGKIGTARNWTGGGSAYFTDTNATHFSPGAQHFSFSTWVNMTSVAFAGGSGDVGILTKCATADNREYILWIATGGDKKFRLFVSNDGIATTTLVWATAPLINTWYHITGGWDGSNVWMSVNAAARITAPFTGPMFQGNVGFQLGFEAGSSAFMNGRIDETGFWIGHDLTTAEVTQLYGGGAGLPFSQFTGNTWASNGTPASIQAIHDAGTTLDGDIITLPSGSFLWDVSAGGTAGVHITKAITLQGNTTTNEVAGTDGGQTVLLDSDARRGAGGRPFIRVDTETTANNPNRSFRITGLAFDKGSATTQNFNGTVTFGGNNRQVRIDHCSFRGNLAGIELLYCQMSGAICGVADHNVFIGSVSFHMDNGDTWPNPNGSIGVSGDGSFAAPTNFGTADFWFIEDNYFKGLDPTHPGGGPDDLRGGRWVWRYNHMYDAPIQSHGTEDGRWHGGRAREVYNNDFHFTNASVGGWGGVRSGVTVFHDNTSAGRWPGDSQYGLSVYRTIHKWPATPFFGASGDNPWDINATRLDGTFHAGEAPFTFDSGTATSTTGSGSVVDNTKSWGTNQYAGYTVKYTGPSGGDNTAIINSNSSNTLNLDHWGNDAGGPHNWATGDTYEIHLVLIVMDQPGRGQCDLLSNATTTLSAGVTFPVATLQVASTAGFPSSAITLQVGGNGPVAYTGKTSNSFTGVTLGYGTIAAGATVNMVLNTTTGTATWPNQALEPSYSWNNLYNGVDGNNRSFGFVPNVGSGGNLGEKPQLVSGRDYFNNTQKPGYTPYTYPHPFVTGIVAPPANKNITLTGPGLAFGNVTIGSISPTANLNVANNGDTLLTVTAVSYPAGFSGPTGGFTVPAGGSFDIVVTFTPLLPQAYSGNISVTSDATTGNGQIACSGTGIAASPPIHGHRKQARDAFQF